MTPHWSEKEGLYTASVMTYRSQVVILKVYDDPAEDEKFETHRLKGRLIGRGAPLNVGGRGGTRRRRRSTTRVTPLVLSKVGSEC